MSSAASVLWGRRIAAATATATATAGAAAAATMAVTAIGSSSKMLSWLPVRTLKRFQCASKSYSSLISSPQFEQDRQNPPLLLTLHDGDDDLDEKPILRFSAYNNQGNLVKNFSRVISDHFGKLFMQSCRGLVCVSPWRTQIQPFLICNPTTEEMITLPPTQDPSCSVGFGFAASTQEFKVVRFFISREGYGWKNRCQVFTLGTSRWREVRPPPYEVYQGSAPFLDGAVHFLRRISNPGCVEETDRIGAFDIETEEYREGVSLPAQYYDLGDCESPDILITRNFLRLSKLGDSLCLTFDYGEMKCRLDMWLLKDYNNGEWVKGHTINISPLYPYPSYCFMGYPVDTMDDNVLLSCTDEDGVNLLSYDPQDGIVKVKKEKVFAATYYVENSHPLTNQR